MERKARFWVMYKGSMVKLTLIPGQTVELVEGGPMEEGYCYERTKLEFDVETVCREWVSESRDCDGRLDHYQDSYCPVSELNSRELFGVNLMLPEWRWGSASQRDYSAERMGY